MKIVSYSPEQLRYFVDEENEEEDREEYNAETEFLLFSPTEEYAVAKWVMDAYCEIWIDTTPDFHKFLELLIHRKSRGKDFTGDHFAKLVHFYERYQSRLPPFPRLKNDGKQTTLTGKEISSFITDSSLFLNIPAKSTFDFQGYIEKVRSKVRLAWYETWDQHPLMRKRAGMHRFPNHEIDAKYIDRQEKLEAAFWEEVERKQKEYDCTRSEAIASVSDYMERADKHQDS